MELHPDLVAVAWLLGSWEGEGEGRYPTITAFSYREQVTWAHVGKPFLAYAQSTWSSDDGRPLHGERGYLRVADGRAELIIAHSSGFTEIATGDPGDPLLLWCPAVAGTPSAKDVQTIDRRFWLEAGELRYELGMAAVGQGHQLHLRGSLRRTS
ncbi:MAG: FABP family protein [Acidimicrobiales bacterium]